MVIFGRSHVGLRTVPLAVTTGALPGRLQHERYEVPRNPGLSVDLATKLVRDRDGGWYPLDDLIVSGDALYYARPVDDSLHFSYYERWLVPARSLVFSRPRFHPHIEAAFDWYIETDFTSIDGQCWQVRDGYLDLEVWEGRRYHLQDAHELAEGLAAGEISVSETVHALDALGRLCEALKRTDCSVRAVLAEYAPRLPL